MQLATATRGSLILNDPGEGHQLALQERLGATPFVLRLHLVFLSTGDTTCVVELNTSLLSLKQRRAISTSPPTKILSTNQKMVTDNELNSIAIFLGTLMMSLIVLYHFLAVNSGDNQASASVEYSGNVKKGAPVVAPVVVSK
ncbi:hypothetical protein BDD12DRAFT_885035 [Trichophaea hybrida]|nr:hypothetical protein BDD12DRAFT_885035 [Trichophaea hybrida]